MLEVESDAAGARLDAFLAAGLGISRSEARWLLGKGAVSLDGRARGPAHKGDRLAAGARVEVAAFTPRAEQRAQAGSDAGFPVLAEGPGWLALDKPAGVPVHPLDEGETGTLLNAALALRPEMHGVGEGGLRSGVVHRLDVETSGAVVMASEEGAWRRLRWAFRRHRVSKRYRAVVAGKLADTGQADLLLVVAQHRPARVRVVEDPATPGARRARLAWRVAERFPEHALLEVDLETGFLHQIRASLAHLGAPVVGDAVYGVVDDALGARRQMLHAAWVRFEEVRAESPDPPDLAALLDRLRG